MVIFGIFGQWIGLKNVGVDVYSLWEQWDKKQPLDEDFFRSFAEKETNSLFVIIRFSISIEC